jgi:hypothetical protein
MERGIVVKKSETFKKSESYKGRIKEYKRKEENYIQIFVKVQGHPKQGYLVCPLF